MTEYYNPFFPRRIAREAARSIMRAKHVPNVNKHMSDKTDRSLPFWKDVLLHDFETITKLNKNKNNEKEKRK